MTQTAPVSYHVHQPAQQAYALDAGGIVGNLIAPELAPTQIAITDVRSAAVAPRFEDASVGFAAFPTEVEAFDTNQDWQPAYDAELRQLLADKVGAQEVVVFDHTVRVDDPEAVRKPARNVHSDYSVDGAKQRLIDILGDDKAGEWRKGHYAFINVDRIALPHKTGSCST